MGIIIKIKNIKIFITILVIFFFQSVNAQFPVDGQYQSIAPPTTPVMPNYGQAVIDNAVPSPIEITRITEAYNYIDGNGDPQVWYPTHGYSKTQIWNADQTLYKIRSWKVYDAVTYQEAQSLSDLYPSYWSNIDADIIWSFRDDGEIKKHRVSTNTTQVVANIPGYEYIKLGPGEANIDKNDHYVALVGKKSNGDLDVIIFDLQTSQVTHTETFANAWADGADYAPKYIDWVSISQSGDYVVIMWNHSTATDNGVNQYEENGNIHYGVEVYNTLNMQFQNRIIRYGNHGDLGYAVDGNEVLVQFYGVYGGGTIYMHKLDGSGSTVISTNTDFGVAGHISCRNLNRPGWAYVTNSLAAQSGQLVAIKLDDSGIVEHFGHHFSSATSYEQAAMAVASPNGDKICFKSDFGTGPNTNPSVAYSFIANLSNASFVEDEQLVNINIYPNPTSDKLYIKKDNLYNYNIQVLSISGKVLIEKNLYKKNVVDISNIEKGMYLIKFINNENHHEIIKKFIVK